MDPSILSSITQLRHELHQNPDLSGQEGPSRDRILSFLSHHGLRTTTDGSIGIVPNLGGTGLGLIIDSLVPGPRVLVRAELDGLPIQDCCGKPWQSNKSVVSHSCGHDGHASILAGLALHWFHGPPSQGAVLLVFQPAEETGQGAQAVLQDPQWAQFKPTQGFTLHGIPGVPLGTVTTKPGTFACGSLGLAISFVGRQCHAAYPDQGINPLVPAGWFLDQVNMLNSQILNQGDNQTFATPVFVGAGTPGFGTTPDDCNIQITVRSPDQTKLLGLRDILQENAQEAWSQNPNPGASEGKVLVSEHDQFPATVNDLSLFHLVAKVSQNLSYNFRELDQPFPWSEDFGYFASQFPCCYLGLGAGEDSPILHSGMYDFPDELLIKGLELVISLVNQTLEV
jgi:amidohydrolase